MTDKIQKAIDFALTIAKDNSHGYSQEKRTGNPDYDCSSLVIAAWQNAGICVREAGAVRTADMRNAFLKCGFIDVVENIGLISQRGLMPGDVLLHEGHHTAMYLGNGKLVHASINELGKVAGGQPGDQTGREICVRTYYNHPWNSILRYVGEMEVKDFQKAFDLEVDGIVGPITRAKMNEALILIKKYIK